MERQKKKLIVCCDGAWFNADNHSDKMWSVPGHLQHSSNVARFCRCVGGLGIDGSSVQITYYQSGIGSKSEIIERLRGSSNGIRLRENIRDAYTFIALNYLPGDEIFLIGWSRGAFIARTIAGFIAAVGLLTSPGLTYFSEIFADWKGLSSPSRSRLAKLLDGPFPDRPNVNDPAYVTRLIELGLTRPEVPIKAVAVWETVGLLGIPSLNMFSQNSLREYAFLDTDVPRNVEYAFQALALDEHRRSFTPTIWTRPRNRPLPKLLKQVWFAGCHGDVGGGIEGNGQADITLAWMMSQLETFINFDRNHFMWQHSLHQMQIGKEKWGCNGIHHGISGMFTLHGRFAREPSEHQREQRLKNGGTIRLLENTNEKMHASVRIRTALGCPGTNGSSKYRSRALDRWRVEKSATARVAGWQDNIEDVIKVREAQEGIRWVKKDLIIDQQRSMKLANFEKLVLKPWEMMPEDIIGGLELEFLVKSPEVWEKFGSIGLPTNEFQNLSQ